jgi:peptide-methionine (S)-S-oxide reductase
MNFREFLNLKKTNGYGIESNIGGGCFWGVEELIRDLPVLSRRRRYTGGDVRNATYRNHGSHAEAIEIGFDPSRP